MNRPLALLLTLIGVVSATEAKAQHFFHKGHARPVAASYSSPSPVASTTSSHSSPYAGSTTATSPTARIYSYSYHTLSPLPARTYVGYGADDFPFHGSPYGHPYDPWTWPMMSGSYGNGLARYYDPPVK